MCSFSLFQDHSCPSLFPWVFRAPSNSVNMLWQRVIPSGCPRRPADFCGAETWWHHRALLGRGCVFRAQGGPGWFRLVGWRKLYDSSTFSNTTRYSVLLPVCLSGMLKGPLEATFTPEHSMWRDMGEVQCRWPTSLDPPRLHRLHFKLWSMVLLNMSPWR